MEGVAIMTKVREWPKSIQVDGGVTVNPSPEQCRRSGFEVYTPEELADIDRSASEAEMDRVSVVDALRGKYRLAARAFCGTAEIGEVDKFEDAEIISGEIEKANLAGNSEKALRLTQLALSLQNLITELRRKDGDDAWDRI